MESLQWTFLLAVALLGVASAGSVILVVTGRCSRAIAVIYGCAWLLVCFAPLALAWLFPGSSPLRPASTLDYAGAMPYAVALGVGAIMMTVVSSRSNGPRPVSPLLTITWARTCLAVVAGTAGVAGWLIVAEGEINDYAFTAALSAAVMAGGGVAAAFAAPGIRRRLPHPLSVLSAVVAALCAASGSGAFIGLFASAALGVVSAVIGQLIASRVARRTESGELALCAAAVTGGVLGLLALGLLDRSAGFFYSGQPTLMLSQAQLVGLGLIYAVVVCAAVAGLLRLTVRAPRPKPSD